MSRPNDHGSSDKTLVVGGGIIGLSTAWELSRRGHRVTLIERGDVGRAASWAAAGILPPNNLATATDPLDRLRAYSHSLIGDWCDRLTEETGIDVGYRRCGGLYIADTPGEIASMTGMTEYWKDQQIDCHAVDLTTLSRREPELADWCDRHPAARAWFTPGEDQIRPPAVLKALHQGCLRNGVTIVRHSEVTAVRGDRDQATVRIGEDRIIGRNAIVCGGSWSGRLLSGLNLRTSVVPVRGQMLMLRTDEPVVRSIVNVGQRYVLCRDDGRTLIGSCEEEVGFDESTTPEMIESLREFAADLCPTLSDAKTEKTWSGLRPLTFDGFPMIGKVPGEDHLYVAAGHFRSGIHFAFGTADLMADLIEEKPSPIDLSDFRVGKQQYRDDADAAVRPRR